MCRPLFTSLAPLAALIAAPAAAGVSDFRLPTTTPQPPPDRQGPVAPDVPESRGATPAPTPSPRATPAPSPSPSATARPARTSGTPVPVVPRATRSAAPAGEPGAVLPQPTASEPIATPSASASSLPAPTIAPTATASAPPPPAQGSSLPWILAALVGLGLAGAAGFAWWRWRQLNAPPPVVVPNVERPRLAPERASTPAPATAAPIPAPAAGPLDIALEPVRLSLTLMNAALAYRLEVSNTGTAPITGLAIGADMIAAHASMSREQQLSGPERGGAIVEQIARIEPGETRLVEGEFRVPFTQIVPIRQGDAALLLPLARFRVTADGAEPLVRTFVVGQPGAGTNLQPFRLDLGPRIYPNLAQHAFA